MKNKYIERIKWEDFRENGILWFINGILHLFGLVIVLEFDNDDNFIEAYPAKTLFRGFPQEINDKSYESVTNYLSNNMGYMMKAFEEEDNE